jgi:hypothetical protein
MIRGCLDLGFGSTLWMWEKSQWDEKRLEIWRKRKKDFVLLYKGHLRENTSDRDGNYRWPGCWERKTPI